MLLCIVLLFSTPCFLHDVLMLNSFCNYHSCTGSGEFNSNWGRLIRTMRVRLDPYSIQYDFLNRDIEKNIVGDVLPLPEQPKFTKTLDMRVAWGPTTARLPGT